MLIQCVVWLLLEGKILPAISLSHTPPPTKKNPPPILAHTPFNSKITMTQTHTHTRAIQLHVFMHAVISDHVAKRGKVTITAIKQCQQKLCRPISTLKICQIHTGQVINTRLTMQYHCYKLCQLLNDGRSKNLSEDKRHYTTYYKEVKKIFTGLWRVYGKMAQLSEK